MLQKIKNLYHLFQSILANLYYGFPSRRLKVIGVTGTDGKTTTTHLIYHILKSNGKKASMISSVFADIAGKKYDTGFHVTTPDVFPLQKFLKQSVESGNEFFVLETTSHALAQNRVSLIDFEVGVITNVTHEHLDFHKKYEDYVQSKAVLLKKAKKVLINKDDKSFSILKKVLPKGFYTYGIRSKSDYQIDIENKLQQKLAEFNRYNYIAAYAVCNLLGIKENNILNSLKTFKLPPGRLETITEKPFITLIDFAHTPNAFHQVLSEVRERYLRSGKRLVHVFGAAGERDRSKRILIGEESGNYSDIVILTEEDYRTENPNKIAEQIAAGLEKKGFHRAESNLTHLTNKSYLIELDRQKALEKAVEIAKSGDVIIATGKGHEKSLCRGKKEYPWDEKKAIMQALTVRKVKSPSSP